jgi:hypothetical protein
VSRLERLTPDERALLELVLRQGFDYDRLGELLGIPRAAVRERALSACDRVAPVHVEEPPEVERRQIVDFLLGQHEGPPPEAISDPTGRDWARAVSTHLRELSEVVMDRAERPDAGASKPDADRDAAGNPWRIPEMVVPFAVYSLLIVAGLTAAIVIGLTHH